MKRFIVIKQSTACALGIALAGCASDGGTTNDELADVAAAAVQAGDTTAHPDLIVANGKHLKWSRAVTERPARVDPPPADRSAPQLEPTDLSDDELAQALAPVTKYKGNEYIGEPAYDLVKAIRAGTTRSSFPASSGTAKVSPVGASGRSLIIGTDGRGYRSDNTTYPMTTVVELSDNTNASNNGIECSGTVVGPSTILTAAHCIYNAGVGWYPDDWYNPGTDTGDPTVYPFGSWGCFTASVPSGFTASGTLSYDYAVVEFGYSGCGSIQPFNATGWKGIHSPSDSEINNSTIFMYGHPDDKTQPAIWGMSGPAGSGIANGTYLDYRLDNWYGMSGSGIYFFESDGWPYVIGVNHGYWGTPGNDADNNFGKRIDSTVLSFINGNSLL